MTSIVHITRKRGDTKRISFSIKSSSKDPVDLTGWTNFVMAINTDKTPTDTSTEAENQTGTILNASLGKVYFPVSGSLGVGTYYYDMQATDENGEITTLVEGRYSVTQDITKA